MRAYIFTGGSLSNYYLHFINSLMTPIRVHVYAL
nr:MAG TPA: hypothetical protein [Caudoviricetes sp.]